MAPGPVPTPSIERLFAKVEITDTCWLWTGGTSMGYGTMTIGSTLDGSRTPIRTHRLAYQLLVGEVDPDQDVHHLCDSRLCMNPDHLVKISRSLHGGHHSRQRWGPMPEGCRYCGSDDIRYSKVGRRHCRNCRRTRGWK